MASIWPSSPSCLTEDESDSSGAKRKRKKKKKRHSGPESRTAKKPKQQEWKEKPVEHDTDALVGPHPLTVAEKHLTERDYGGALMAGEGSAMAAYVQSGKRIPRRGEIGLTSDQIEGYEGVGYVMSGSRHQMMNAVRLRKENQVISAEEKKALLMFTQEANLKKEAEIISSFKDLVSSRINSSINKDET